MPGLSRVTPDRIKSTTYECVAPNIDINLQSAQFWATSIASFRQQ